MGRHHGNAGHARPRGSTGALVTGERWVRHLLTMQPWGGTGQECIMVGGWGGVGAGLAATLTSSSWPLSKAVQPYSETLTSVLGKYPAQEWVDYHLLCALIPPGCCYALCRSGSIGLRSQWKFQEELSRWNYLSWSTGAQQQAYSSSCTLCSVEQNQLHVLSQRHEVGIFHFSLAASCPCSGRNLWTATFSHMYNVSH